MKLIVEVHDNQDKSTKSVHQFITKYTFFESNNCLLYQKVTHSCLGLDPFNGH